jgi:hypothetical protein
MTPADLAQGAGGKSAGRDRTTGVRRSVAEIVCGERAKFGGAAGHKLVEVGTISKFELLPQPPKDLGIDPEAGDQSLVQVRLRGPKLPDQALSEADPDRVADLPRRHRIGAESASLNDWWLSVTLGRRLPAALASRRARAQRERGMQRGRLKRSTPLQPGVVPQRRTPVARIAPPRPGPVRPSGRQEEAVEAVRLPLAASGAQRAKIVGAGRMQRGLDLPEGWSAGDPLILPEPNRAEQQRQFHEAKDAADAAEAALTAFLSRENRRQRAAGLPLNDLT